MGDSVVSDYVILADSTADLSKEFVDRFDVSVIPMRFTMGGRTYLDTDISSHEFYSSLKNSRDVPTTTQVNPGEYSDYFEKFLNNQMNVIYVCFSSALSGTYNSACIAANDLNSKYKCKVRVVDSLSASLGEGLMIYKAAIKRQNGASFEEVVEWLEEYKHKVAHIFTVDDLNQLSKSGRLTKASAFFGTMMNIKPVLHVDDNGELVLLEKVRGRNKAIDLMAEKTKEYSEGIKNDLLMIAHGDCLDDANRLAEKIKEKLGNIDISKNIVFGNVTPIIGSHTGLGTLAVFFESNRR